jgi:hypothetical protein
VNIDFTESFGSSGQIKAWDPGIMQEILSSGMEALPLSRKEAKLSMKKGRERREENQQAS